MPVLPERTVRRLPVLEVAGVDGGALYRVATDSIGREAERSPGDGRPRGSGGGGPDQAPSVSAWNPLPPYPPEALARGVEGVVLLRVWIRADGAVQAVKIHRSSGNALLDESAVSTVRDRWQFAPARSGGLGVPWEGLLPIRFTVGGR